MTHWHITVTEIICTIIAPEKIKKRNHCSKNFAKKLLKRTNILYYKYERKCIECHTSYAFSILSLQLYASARRTRDPKGPPCSIWSDVLYIAGNRAPLGAS